MSHHDGLIRVLGDGAVGYKSNTFLRHTPALLDVGFRVPGRSVLTQSLVDEMLLVNGLGKNLDDAVAKGLTQEQVKRRALTGTLPSALIRIFDELNHFYDGHPLMIRSSAVGDSTGTGGYESVCHYHADKLAADVIEVVASYFSERAYDYRRKSGVGLGFDLLVEPLVGAWMGTEKDMHLAPILSGYAYSSIPREAAYLGVVPGLGCGVKSDAIRGVERITQEKIGLHPNLATWIVKERLHVFHDGAAKHESRLLALEDQHNWERIPGYAYHPNQGVMDRHLHFPGGNETTAPARYLELLSKVDLRVLFRMIKALEQKVQERCYVEWALTFEGNEPRFWALQLSPVAPDPAIDLRLDRTPLFHATNVPHSGVKRCQHIVFLRSQKQLEQLKSFNRDHEDYILVVPGRLITNQKDPIDFSNYSNAGVVLEWADYVHHERSALGHFSGLLRESKILFGSIDPEMAAQMPDSLRALFSSTDSFHVAPINLEVRASLRENRLEVYT